MKRRNLQKYADLKELPCALQDDRQAISVLRPLDYFDAKNRAQLPVVLEVGCGRGEYSLALAGRFPDKNVIGIDIQGERLWYGCQKALAAKLLQIA